MFESGAGRRFRGNLYPERQAPQESGLDRVMITALGHVRRLLRGRPAGMRTIGAEVERCGEPLRTMSEEELAWQVRALRPELRAQGFRDDLVARAFALVREFSGRRLGMRHFEVQLQGGRVLLNGMVAEMRTGEGKTLVATLPACTLALAGIPVHIITVNDYLASRDAEWMQPVYEAMGLRVGRVVHEASQADRHRAYRCDVTYCTNKEIVFDYLRDRLDLGRRPGPIRARLDRLTGAGRIDRLRLRGLCFAIVDEADSVLIDEARTPLIISGPGDNAYEVEIYRTALELAERLRSGTDYFIDFPKRRVELNDRGRERLAELAEEIGGFWNGRLRREDLIRKALTARHLFHRDKQYVVKRGKVQIVDEYTGRIMPGRAWEGGLHQLVETKECCELTTETEIRGRISYQRFFRRYLGLAGMTGTAREATAEFWSVYRLPVVTVPTNRPMQLRTFPDRIYPAEEQKWTAVVERIADLHAAGRPLLVGTRTVADSELLAGRLDAAGLPCRVLNANQDREEAEIISRAGRGGQITVATNMAGRGTDIKLEPGVAELGGLHVIATARHDAGRIDRQLFGRGGRQGDPGTCEAFVSLEDELFEGHPAWLRRILSRLLRRADAGAGRALVKILVDRAQRAAERKYYLIRRELLDLDESLESWLAFSGRGE